MLGEAWMTGLLAGIEDSAGWDLRRCEYFVGTSAGSIVAAGLAAGHHPRRPSTRHLDRPSAGGTPKTPGHAGASAAETVAAWAVAIGSPLAPLTLSLAAPAGRLARAAALRVLRGPGQASLRDLRRRIDSTPVRFDGRLRIVAVERRSGRRVVFGRPSMPHATVGEAVEASCSVPWLFEPVRIGGVEYVDGGVWSPTNLDAAPAGRGSYVLCLNPTAGLTGPDPFSVLARTASRSVAAVEAAALRSRGARVVTVVPDAGAISAIGRNLMAHDPHDRVLAAGFAQGISLCEDPRLRLLAPAAAREYR